MNAALFLTTFPARDEFDRARMFLQRVGAAYKCIEPSPALSLVALPALVMSREIRSLLEEAVPKIFFSGWVDYMAPLAIMPEGPEPNNEGACFSRAVVMFIGPCVSDETKIRLIAHLEGNLGPVLPYLNAVITRASYTPAAETLTYMEGQRMISLYRQCITIAKADEIVDAWLTLDNVRKMAEQTWRDRDMIEPSYEIRKKPPAIEIFKRLPRINCRQCGEATCLAFAVMVWSGEISASQCLPVFGDGGTYTKLQEPLLEICAGMGLAAPKLSA